MPSLLAIFFKAPDTRPWLVLLCLLVASATEGLGIVTLLPLISLATDQAASDSAMSRVITDGLAWLGLESTLGVLLAVVVCAVVFKAILSLIAMSYVGYAAAEVATALRRRLIDTMLAARWRFLIKLPLGRIANVVSNDATRSAEAYLLVAQLVALMVQTVVYSLIALVVSWELALTAVAFGLAMAAALNFLTRISKKAGWAQTARTNELLVFLSDTLNNIKPVKAMARGVAFANLLDQKTWKLRKALRRQVITKEALNNIQDMFIAIFLGVGFFLALTIWQVHISEVLVAGILLARTVASIGKLQKAHQKAVLLESAYYAAQELIRETEADPEPNPGTRTPEFKREIRFDAVSFAHDDTPVLKEMDLVIKAGELTVLSGQSGAGKTTIIDLVLGLHQPTGGRVLIDDVPLREIDLQQWRRMVGYVPQDLILLHDTVRANITLGDSTIDDAAIAEALVMAGLDEFIASLPEGLDTVVGEKGARLSGGQRQRIALARAVAGRPRLLILDEVTSALDPETAVALAKRIQVLSRQVAVLTITHRPEFLDIADRLYEVADGKARETDLAAIPEA